MSRPFPAHIFEKDQSVLISPREEWVSDELAHPIAASSLTLRDHFSMDTVPESLWNDMRKVFQDYYYQVAGLPEYISTAPMKIRKAMVETLDKVRVTKYCTFPS